MISLRALLLCKDSCFLSLYTESGVQIQQGCRTHVLLTCPPVSFLMSPPCSTLFILILVQCCPYYSLSEALVITSPSLGWCGGNVWKLLLLTSMLLLCLIVTGSPVTHADHFTSECKSLPLGSQVTHALPDPPKGWSFLRRTSQKV